MTELRKRQTRYFPERHAKWQRVEKPGTQIAAHCEARLARRPSPQGHIHLVEGRHGLRSLGPIEPTYRHRPITGTLSAQPPLRTSGVGNSPPFGFKLSLQDRKTEDLLTAELRYLRDDAAIVHLIGEVDISSSHLLDTQLANVANSELRDVIIDATGVSFMDSTGLHSLVEGKKLLHDTGTRIVLVASPQVRRILELVFPDHLFAARVDSVDEALGIIEDATEHEPI